MANQNLNRKSMKFVSFGVLFAVLGMSVQVDAVDAATNSQVRNRISHAKELLGSHYKKSDVRKTEKAMNVSDFVASSTKNLLPKAHKGLSRSIASAIMSESQRYGFDPIFLMAVIQNESSFNPRMKGSVGEIGLMQIKPDTAQWIAKSYKISYKGAKDLYNPETNIRIGAAFMSKLRSQFSSQSNLYLSAYNAGAKRVRIMVSENNAPKQYATAVMKRYLALYSALGTKADTAQQGALALANVRNVTVARF